MLRRAYGGRRTEVEPVGSGSIPARLAKTETNGGGYMKSTLGNYGGPMLFVQRREVFVNEMPIFSTLRADIKQKSQLYLASRMDRER